MVAFFEKNKWINLVTGMPLKAGFFGVGEGAVVKVSWDAFCWSVSSQKRPLLFKIQFKKKGTQKM